VLGSSFPLFLQNRSQARPVECRTNLRHQDNAKSLKVGICKNGKMLLKYPHLEY
jgi:hypothetical protein